MKDIQLRKINPIILLLFLVLFGFLSFLITKDNNVAAANLDLKPVYIDSSVKETIKSNTVSHISSTTEAVLGCGDENNPNCDFINQIAYQPLCTYRKGDISLASGDVVSQTGETVRVKKNSIIEIYSITSPQSLMAGSEYVKDEKFEITNEFPTIRSSGNLLLEDEVYRFCAPGKECDSVKKRVGGAPGGSFAVHAEASMLNSPEGNGNEPNTVVINPVLKSVCPAVQNSEINPARSNISAEYLERNFQAPGNTKTNRDVGEAACIAADPSIVDLKEEEGFISCMAETSPFDFIKSSIIKIDQWLECNAGDNPDPSKCDEEELFAIKVDAIFGSISDCESGNCASRYFDMIAQSTATPLQSVQMTPEGFTAKSDDPVVEPFYVTTPCKVRVDKGKVYDLPCLWDMSPYKRQYESYKSNTHPGYDDVPKTWEEYWSKVESDIQRRGLSCR